MKKFWIAFLVFIVIILFLFWQIFELDLKREANYKIGKVCINNNCFDVELAQTNFQIEKGLMFRDKLDQNKGMLFVFNKEAIYPFWMKNTKIPLDIIWIEKNPSTSSGQVVYISEFAQPCKTFFCPKVNPQKEAKYVLEINAGLSQKLDIKVGDNVDIMLE